MDWEAQTGHSTPCVASLVLKGKITSQDLLATLPMQLRIPPVFFVARAHHRPPKLIMVLDINVVFTISTWFYCQIKILLDVKKYLSSSWLYAYKDMWLRVWRLIHFVTAFCNRFRSVIFFSIWLFAPLSREVGRKTKSLYDLYERFSPGVKVSDSSEITCIPTVTHLFYHEESENILEVFSWEKISSATTGQDLKKCFFDSWHSISEAGECYCLTLF